MIKYRRTQFSRAIITLAVIVLCCGAYLLVAKGPQLAILAALSFAMLISALFCKLTIEVSDDWIDLLLGTGLIRKRIFFIDISSCNVVEAPIYSRSGDLMPLAWLYHLSGSYAVEIRTRDGNICLIGWDTPGELQHLIRQKA